MRNPARLGLLILYAVFTAPPGRASISVNWLDTPTVLWTEFSTQYEPVDLNNDGLIDLLFGADISSVGVRREGNSRYLIYPSPPPNIGGYVEPLQAGFEIGSDSGSGELDWFGYGGFSSFIICLSGSGGDTCAGRFPGQRAYMGVEFEIGGATHYGWLDMFVASDNPYAEIYGWAWETVPGVSLGAGVVPEPSAILLLAAGSIALLCRTKRRIR